MFKALTRRPEAAKKGQLSGLERLDGEWAIEECFYVGRDYERELEQHDRASKARLSKSRETLEAHIRVVAIYLPPPED